MIAARLKHLPGSRFVRYLFVGGVGYLFEMLVLFVAAVLLSLGNTLSVSLSYWLGLVFSFVLQKILAFGNRDARPAALSVQTALFGVLVLVNYAFTVVFASLTAAVIGVFLARTLALIVTTAWNYLAYKHVIFNPRVTEAGNERFRLGVQRLHAWLGATASLTLLSVITLALTVCFGLMSALANPVADDFAYYQNLKSSESPLGYVLDHYLTHNGRLTQNILVTALYEVFGKHAIQTAPALLFAALAAALSWVAWLMLPNARKRTQLALVLGAFIASISLLAAPSTFDSYLWFTSSTVYLGSIIGLAVNVSLAILLSRSERTRPWLVALALLGMFLSQSFSEPTALVAIVASALWVGWELVQKRWRQMTIALFSGAALVAGFAVNFFSPSTTSRRSEVELPFSLRRIVFESLERYNSLFNALEPWLLLLVLCAAAVTAAQLGTRAGKLRFQLVLLTLAGLTFLGSTYFVFAVSSYGSSYFPLRNYTLPAFGTIISLFLAGTSLFSMILTALRDRGGKLILGLGILVGLGLSFPAALQMSVTQIQALSLRDSFVTARTNAIDRQLSEGATAVVVQAAPVPVVSEAVEIENHTEEQVPWLIAGFRSWHEIPTADSLDVQLVPFGYCVPGTAQVRPEFWCN